MYDPMPTPSRPWESISMDYMFDLPSIKHGNDCVFVVIDRFFFFLNGRIGCLQEGYHNIIHC